MNDVKLPILQSLVENFQVLVRSPCVQHEQKLFVAAGIRQNYVNEICLKSAAFIFPLFEVTCNSGSVNSERAT